MRPNHHFVRLEPEPPGLIDELHPVLKAQGTPAVTVARADGALAFESETAEFMLQARVADALSTTCPDWQERLVR